jgi:hypothetical protein
MHELIEQQLRQLVLGNTEMIGKIRAAADRIVELAGV